MNKPSFHERLWDLQRRKQGEARLKMRLEWERIGAKLQMNSFFGKIGTYRIDERYNPIIIGNVFNHLRAKRFEVEKASREFRPF